MQISKQSRQIEGPCLHAKPSPVLSSWHSFAHANKTLYNFIVEESTEIVETRALDSLGGGHVLRGGSLDSLGGGHVLRQLDPLGGGHILRGLDSLGGGHILRDVDGGEPLPPSHFRYQHKRGLDPLR